MDLYADNILDHYRHPRMKGEVGKAEWSSVHEEKNLSCGDKLTLGVRIENDKIAELQWEGEGCAISQAGMSILAEELTGKTLAEAAALSPDDIYKLLGVPVGTRRLKCALLCLHTFKNTLHSCNKEPAQSWHETVDGK